MLNFDLIYSDVVPKNNHKFLIAYSGGVDSHVLLHGFATLRKKYSHFQVRAVYINHGLNINANSWQQHCSNICKELDITFVAESIIIERTGESLEALAREKRYQALGKLLQPDEYLLTAHHQDDQAETLLLQLLRGAGPKGLAAMPQIKKFHHGYLIRPLLNFSRDDIHEYAQYHQLKWIEDDSNIQRRFDRNFIRQEIVPLLKQRWPSVAKNFSRSAQHCAETVELLEEIARTDLESIKKDHSLCVSKLLLLSSSRQRNVLRVWMREFNVIADTKKTRQIQMELLHSSQTLISWNHIEVRRYRDHIYLLKKTPVSDPALMIPWNLQQPLVLPADLGILRVRATRSDGIKSSLDLEQISVRFRRGGETCRIPKRSGSHELKKLFQEWGVPSWLRDRIPLLYYQEQLMAVVGYCICEGFQAQENTDGLMPILNSLQPH